VTPIRHPGARSAARPAAQAAFTLVEVLCGVMVLSLGLVVAVSMVLYGIHLGRIAIGRTTGMATAMSVAVDATPLLPASPDWTVTVPGTTRGYLNGFWVERTEDAPQTVTTRNPYDTASTACITTANVTVDVYETPQGRLIASYNLRILRQKPWVP
jgi:prepilin-type N-terminal cleavage/methylation domain-containing protein